MSRPAPLDRSAFSCFRSLPTRWSDNDFYGHMNNVVHYALFDTAINGWLIENGLLDLKNGAIIGMVVHTRCDYFAELAFPQTITAGLAISRLGTSSATYRIGLFGDGEQAAAQGEFVHVYTDRATRRPQPIPEHWRAVLETIAL
jgi:acyl-CoA thioester hydrolase